MTTRPMTITLHRASDQTPVNVEVDQIRFFQALTHDRAPFTKVALFAMDEVVLESTREIQRLCLGC